MGPRSSSSGRRWAVDWIARSTRDHALREGFVGGRCRLPLPRAARRPVPRGRRRRGRRSAILMPDLSDRARSPGTLGAAAAGSTRPGARSSAAPARLHAAAVAESLATPRPAGHVWPMVPARRAAAPAGPTVGRAAAPPTALGAGRPVPRRLGRPSSGSRRRRASTSSRALDARPGPAPRRARAVCRRSACTATSSSPTSRCSTTGGSPSSTGR